MTNLERLVRETTDSVIRRQETAAQSHRFAYCMAKDPGPCAYCIIQIPHSEEQCAAAQIMPREVQ